MHLLVLTDAQGRCQIYLFLSHYLPCTVKLISLSYVLIDALKGVRYRNETVHETLSQASMAGGMELFIDGSGMDEAPQLNTIIFKSTQNEGQEPVGPAQDRK